MAGFLDPKEVLEKLPLKENMIAADFGSGSGGWAIPLAKKLEEGKVYAIDLLEEPLSALRAKARLERLYNIQTVLANVEKGIAILRDASCNLVLMTNLLFQCEDKRKVLEEGKRILKPGGRILVVDWKKDTALGPKEGRVLPEEVKKTAEEIGGLRVEKEFDAGNYHYALVFTKS